jgi:hypothetical protein
MGFPCGLSVVGLAVQLGGPQLAMMGHDPPAAIVEKDDKERITVFGEPFDAILLAAVGQSQPQAENGMLRAAGMLGPLQG